jgi:hypothetical protein
MRHVGDCVGAHPLGEKRKTSGGKGAKGGKSLHPSVAWDSSTISIISTGTAAVGLRRSARRKVAESGGKSALLPATTPRRRGCYSAAMTDQALPDQIPDRLSTNPKSPHYDEALLTRGVGIKFDGQEKTNVEEYCMSEGWIRVAVGKTVDRKGNPLTIKLTGKVEPYFQK